MNKLASKKKNFLVEDKYWMEKDERRFFMGILSTIIYENRNLKCAGHKLSQATPFEIQMDVWNESDEGKWEEEISKFTKHLEDVSNKVNAEIPMMSDKRKINRELTDKEFAEMIEPAKDWGHFYFPMSRPPFSSILIHLRRTIPDSWVKPEQYEGFSEDEIIWLIDQDYDDGEYFRYSLVRISPRLWFPPAVDERIATTMEKKFSDSDITIVYGSEDTRLDFYQEKETGRIDINNTYFKTLDGGLAFGYTQLVRRLYARDIYTAMKICSIINCSNVITEKKVQASKKVNRRREKNGKKPLVPYYTLSIKPKTSYKHEGSKQDSSDSQNRKLHLVRGHFKHYTKDAPLFGKYTGLYWWQPHVRGE